MSDLGAKVPGDVAQGVRSGILAALAQDVDLRGGRTARRLAFAGVVGVAGALGATLIFSTHPFGHHPSWHQMVFSTLWAGLLVVSLSLVLLRVQTPALPIGRAAAVGLVGLGLAGMCSLLCPDPHVMAWWLQTALGRGIAERTSMWTAALCLGFGSVSLFAWASAFLLLQPPFPGRARHLLAALFVTLLLLPGVSLASFGQSLGVCVGWIAGVAAGGYMGVAAAAHLRLRLAERIRGASAI